MLKLGFLGLTVVLIAVVWAKGRRDEKSTAAFLITASLISPLVSPRHFYGPEAGIVTIDLFVLAWLTGMALVSDRFWPLFAAGFQLDGVAVHLAQIVTPDGVGHAYANAEVFWAYPVYFALIIGSIVEARRRQR